MRRPPLLGVALALVAGLLAGLLVLRSGAAPELTRPALEEARRTWEAEGPASYRLEIRMSGALDDTRRIVVRDGRVIEMTIDGRPASEGSWSYWSVDGMFGFLATELDNAADPPASLGVGDGDQIVLRARFDDEFGYPTHFFRHILGRQSGTQWDVVAFEPIGS